MARDKTKCNMRDRDWQVLGAYHRPGRKRVEAKAFGFGRDDPRVAGSALDSESGDWRLQGIPKLISGRRMCNALLYRLEPHTHQRQRLYVYVCLCSSSIDICSALVDR